MFFLKAFMYLDGAFRFGMIFLFIACVLVFPFFRFVLKRDMKPAGYITLMCAFVVGAVAGIVYYLAVNPVNM
jgi:hypothetical protein